MQLRVIVAVLSLIALLSAVPGGYLYFSSLAAASARAAEQEGRLRMTQVSKQVTYALLENIEVLPAMAGLATLRTALLRPADPAAIARANHLLVHFATSLGGSVCYLLTRDGDTIAASNHAADDSFVGQNYAWRPYFRDGFVDPPATYLAVGTRSGKRGVYHSYPIYDEGRPIGLVVLKKSVDQVERDIHLSSDERVLVADPSGIVFISNVPKWRLKSLGTLDTDTVVRVAEARQFGDGPWPWIGLQSDEPGRLSDPNGNAFDVFETNLEGQLGWRFLYMRRPIPVSERLLSDLPTPAGILTVCLVIGLSVALLYRKATRELQRRRSTERALRDNEARYRSLYHRTPAMLHSIDRRGRLVSVSDYWLQVMGYDRGEVLGRQLTDFLTASSREHYREVFPRFMATGQCTDVPYELVKRDGEIVDVLLSAIGERESTGESKRSLAVSINVTRRKRAEEALRAAKDELARYSKELERIVRERTRETMDILANTPAVVHIKDLDGRYRFVNPRFEALFDLSNAVAQRKTDHDIFPKSVADQLQANDRQVVSTRAARQFEEQIPLEDGLHTYLSVKFPIFDETRAVKSVCCISTDITDVKRAEIQMRRLSDRILANQEKERAALARELHDELGQNLTALRMDSVWLRSRLDGDTVACRRASEMTELIDKTIDDVRGLTFRLRPGMLDDLGLVDALDLYTTDFERRTGIPCVFEHQGTAAPETAVATAAYRITQEALTNVARHACANHVDVSLQATRNTLRLAVEDDGCGFAAESLDEHAGLGLAGMRERAVLVGGDLEVDSARGKGTRVCFQVDLPPPSSVVDARA